MFRVQRILFNQRFYAFYRTAYETMHYIKLNAKEQYFNLRLVDVGLVLRCYIDILILCVSFIYNSHEFRIKYS